MKLFTIFITAIFLLASEPTAQIEQEDNNISKKIYNIKNDQVLFNSIKRVFYSSEHKNILDTNWTSLEMNKRVLNGFVDIDVEVQSVILSSKALDENGTKELSLEIFTTQNDDITHFKADSFLHRLFWNRVEFILGLEDDWINCNYTIAAILHRKHMLCGAQKAKVLEAQELQKAQEIVEAQELQDILGTQKLEESQDIQETQELQETQKLEESQDILETKETQKSEDLEVLQKTKELLETQELLKLQEMQES